MRINQAELLLFRMKSTMISSRSLLLPVETLNREFDGKLLLGLHAVERGWSVIIGDRVSLHKHLGAMPPSVYFSKGFRSGNRIIFKTIAGLGHSIVALDEEGLVPFSDEMVLLRMDREVLEKLQMAFVWGEDNVRLYGKIDGLDDVPVIPTGNPRIDMMRPDLRAYFDEEISALHERYGRFILFNSNFSLVNHFIPEKSRFKVANWVPEEQAQALKSELLAHKAQLFEAFQTLIPKLAKAAGPHCLVIRPHPSENHQVWIEAAKGYDNIHVIHEGNVIPWLAAADVLVHNGCTSAVEASVIGTPALAYRPVTSEAFDLHLPNSLSQEFYDDEGVLSVVTDYMRAKKPKPLKLDAKQKNLLDAHVSALDGALACTRILDEIEAHETLLERKITTSGYLQARWQHGVSTLGRRLRAVGKKDNDRDVYARHKFPQISQAEVAGRIDRFRRAMGTFDGVSAHELKPSLFSLSR